jgi:hypothetical protein
VQWKFLSSKTILGLSFYGDQLLVVLTVDDNQIAPMEKHAGTGSSPEAPNAHPELESNTTPPSQENDVAIGLVGERAQEIDPGVEARALRKIDWFLIPAMIVGEHTVPSHTYSSF